MNMFAALLSLATCLLQLKVVLVDCTNLLGAYCVKIMIHTTMFVTKEVRLLKQQMNLFTKQFSIVN